MIYISGDTHGDFKKIFWNIDRFDITENDTIIILGDAGLNYFGNDKGDFDRKRAVNNKGVKIFCIHGNHEARPETLVSYHITEFNGGKVYVEDAFPNLFFAIDGEVYDFDGKKTLVLGGAYSVDKYYRLARGYKWFDDEQPSEKIKLRTDEKLNEIGWKVDIVLSHTCPKKYIPTEAFLPSIDQSTVDNSTEEWLDGIEDKLSYEKWYCGHWHIDKTIDNIRFVMYDFLSLDCEVDE